MKMSLKSLMLVPHFLRSSTTNIGKMLAAFAIRGRWTSTPCRTSLVFKSPELSVKTETSCPMSTNSCVMYSAYVPKPPTSLGGYSQTKNPILYTNHPFLDPDNYQPTPKY